MADTWHPISTAPKSLADGNIVHGNYILGYCPDEELSDPQACICVCWWEPLMPTAMNDHRGMWYGEGGYELRPTHWMPLPKAPSPGKGGA